MKKDRKNIVAVIRDAYVVITNNYKEAVILNQFIYWTMRVYDYDNFITEENERITKENNNAPRIELTSGWIYKKAEALSKETLLGLNPGTIRTYIRNLVEAGYISERNNPKYSWDKTKQYRINPQIIIEKIQEKDSELTIPQDLANIENLMFQHRKSNVRTEKNTVSKPRKSISNTIDDNIKIKNKEKNIPLTSTSTGSSNESTIYSQDSSSYLVAEYLFNRIIENYPNYRKKEHSSSKLIEKKLQDWSIAIDRMFRIDEKNLDEILKVIDWTQDNHFWRKNIKSTWKLREKYEDLLIEMEEDSKKSTKVKKVVLVKQPDDPNPDLTQSIVKAYSWLINNKEYIPTDAEMTKFMKTSEKMLKFYKTHSVMKENWVKYLKKCMEKNYTEKGDTLYVGHLCSDSTWNILMPQFLSELGI
ncbi:MAG: hypothetical protein ACTSUP_08075 [Candidatus Heimdallarchaeaceae archaeon]